MISSQLESVTFKKNIHIHEEEINEKFLSGENARVAL
jgi:hypothetical protein